MARRKIGHGVRTLCTVCADFKVILTIFLPIYFGFYDILCIVFFKNRLSAIRSDIACLLTLAKPHPSTSSQLCGY